MRFAQDFHDLLNWRHLHPCHGQDGDEKAKSDDFQREMFDAFLFPSKIFWPRWSSPTRLGSRLKTNEFP
jgi:hypothetical protein